MLGMSIKKLIGTGNDFSLVRKCWSNFGPSYRRTNFNCKNCASMSKHLIRKRYDFKKFQLKYWLLMSHWQTWTSYSVLSSPRGPEELLTLLASTEVCKPVFNHMNEWIACYIKGTFDICSVLVIGSAFLDTEGSTVPSLRNAFKSLSWSRCLAFCKYTANYAILLCGLNNRQNTAEPFSSVSASAPRIWRKSYLVNDKHSNKHLSNNVQNAAYYIHFRNYSFL